MSPEPGKKPSWDSYFLGIARAVAARSSCTRSKVGAVVVSSDRRIRGTGYNDSPAGQPGCESCPRRTSGVVPCSSYSDGAGKCVSVHAEANALLYADRSDLQGSTLYITRDPCPDCSKLIAATGIERVVCPSGSYDPKVLARYFDVPQRLLVGVDQDVLKVIS